MKNPFHHSTRLFLVLQILCLSNGLTFYQMSYAEDCINCSYPSEYRLPLPTVETPGMLNGIHQQPNQFSSMTDEEYAILYPYLPHSFSQEPQPQVIPPQSNEEEPQPEVANQPDSPKNKTEEINDPESRESEETPEEKVAEERTAPEEETPKKEENSPVVSNLPPTQIIPPVQLNLPSLPDAGISVGEFGVPQIPGDRFNFSPSPPYGSKYPF